MSLAIPTLDHPKKSISRVLGAAKALRKSLLFFVCASLLVNCGEPRVASAEEKIERHVRVNGTNREYILHMPRDRAGGPHPVLFAFHPGGATAEWMEENAGFHRAANARDFVVVYPEGFRRSFNAGVCCGFAVERNVDDVAFFQAMMQDIAELIPVRREAYITGFSNGAMMNYRLICEVPHLIAAAAPFAGAAPMNGCAGAPVPVMHVNGQEDEVSLKGGEREAAPMFGSTSRTLTPPLEALQAIAQRNGCSSSVGSEVRIQAMDASCQRFQNCPGSAPVMFCVIPGLGHAWPGGPAPTGGGLRARIGQRFGPYRPELRGTEAIVDFFRQH